MAEQKIDSNATGLRIAEEQTLKQLPVTPIWNVAEPNTYSDFGGSITTVARNPINASRQQRKGVVTDLDAKGGFQTDLTQKNMTKLMQGFFFADAREKPTTAPLNAAAIVVSGIVGSTKTITVASGGTSFKAGQRVMLRGFSVAANNGLKTVASSTATTIVVSDVMTDEAAPPAGAAVQCVGFVFASGDAKLVMNGGLVQMTVTTADFTTLGLIPGEWIFVGGDSAGAAFANGTGLARVSRITAKMIEFDKVGWNSPVADAGTGKTIHIFFGTVIQNENDPALIKRRTYQLERTLGNDADGVMSQYVTGAVPNQLTINIAQASKVTADVEFIACDVEQRSGLVGQKSGTRPPIEDAAAFNTSSDFSRIKLGLVDNANASVQPLFAFGTEMSLVINNNVSPNKAVGVLGAFSTSAGIFAVTGKLTAYFADVAAVQAVRNNADITLDFAIVKQNAGLVFDIPLLSLGGGMIAVEANRPVTVPLETNAAQSKFGTTLLLNVFPYLPNVAQQ